MERKSVKIISVFVMVSLLSSVIQLPGPAFGQGLGRSGGGKDRIEGNMKLLPIPYVNYNRSFGYQIGALPVLLFNPVKSDSLSPSSMAGAITLYSENETWFVMGFSMLHLSEDKWRVMAAGGYGSLNFQFFLDSPINSWIPYNTEVEMVFTQVQRRVLTSIYAGFSLIHMNLKTTTDKIPVELNNQLNGLGLQLEMDRRSNVRYPRSGFITRLKYFSYPAFFGNEDVSGKIEIHLNGYYSVRKNKDVLAGRFFAGLGLGDLTFNQQLIVGGKDIRGYTQGEFRGNYQLALQGEYRWNFHKRLGMVGFAGIATVFEAINDNDNGRLLPGVGAGFRFTADTETHMNVGMDLAFGINDWGIYFRISEAF